MKRKLLFRATAVILAVASLAATIVVKISEFPAVTTPADTDLLLLSSGATNKNITFANLRNALGGTPSTVVNNIFSTNISVTNLNVQNITVKGKSAAETYVNGTDVLRPNFKDGAAIAFVVSGTTNITPTLGALTGDVTTSANGLATTIANSAITDAKVSASAAIARSKLAAGTANHILINDNSGVPSSEATLGATRFPPLTGDVTTPGGSLATTIANGAVTYAKMQNISATQKVLGRNTAGSGSAEEVGISALLDWLGSTRGSTLYRGASGWTIATPGTAGYVWTANGAGADPSFQAPAFVGIYRDQSIEAGAMLVGNLASPATTGTYTNSQDDTLSDSWTFADAATNSVRFSLTLPDVWNLGTVKLKLYVTCDNTNNTSTNLVWGVKAGSLAPLEALTGAIFGTEVYVTNGLDTAGNVLQVFTTPAITVGGSPAMGDSIWFNIAREGGNASDTWTNTPVRLLKARVQWLESSTAPSSW